MNKALFLDRDGVINVDVGHLHRIDDCIFNESIFKIAKQYQDNGYLIIVITNQAGIAKGLYTEQTYFILRRYIHDEFTKHGVYITDEYYCPHHPDYTGECECRKPKPGMILQAVKDWEISLSQSIMIGDKEWDREAAKAAGVKTFALWQEVINYFV